MGDVAEFFEFEASAEEDEEKAGGFAEGGAIAGEENSAEADPEDGPEVAEEIGGKDVEALQEEDGTYDDEEGAHEGSGFGTTVLLAVLHVSLLT